MQGNLNDMTVADLIQHNCQDRKTLRLNIQHNNHQACLYFKNGNVVHALCEDLEGEEVVYKLLNWETGTFEQETGVEPPKVTVMHGWSALLLEGARRLDENRPENNLFEPNIILQGKDNKMNIKRLNKVVDDLKEDLGTALVATNSWKSGDAQSLAGYNSNPKATALFNEITRNLAKSLKDSGFPGLGKYYMVNLENNFMVIVVIQGDFQEGMMVDLSKTTLGLLINIALPKVLEGLAEAVR